MACMAPVAPDSRRVLGRLDREATRVVVFGKCGLWLNDVRKVEGRIGDLSRLEAENILGKAGDRQGLFWPLQRSGCGLQMFIDFDATREPPASLHITAHTLLLPACEVDHCRSASCLPSGAPSRRLGNPYAPSPRTARSSRYGCPC
jgi:hypothetical protein